jgi:hypothetical protein
MSLVVETSCRLENFVLAYKANSHQAKF